MDIIKGVFLDKLDKGLPLCFKYDNGQMTAVVGANKYQARAPIFDHFLQQLGLYVSNKASNILFQSVKCLRFICVDKQLHIIIQKTIVARNANPKASLNSTE